jgi:hypothetical protein
LWELIAGSHHSSESILRDNPARIPPTIRLAALVICGLGVSSYSWSIENLAPIVVDTGKQSVLALMWTRVLESDTYHEMEFNLIKSEEVSGLSEGLRPAWLLMATHTDNPGFRSYGLFPNISVEDSEDSTWEKVGFKNRP